MEWLGSLAGFRLNHVPYRGISPAIPDLLANRVSAMFSAINGVLPLVQEGKLVPLAISGTRRSPVLPAVPTFAELGLPNYEASFYLGLAAPAGTPAPVLERLSTAVRQVVQSPDFRARAQQSWGMEPIGDRPAEFAAYLKRDRASAANRVRISGARLDN